MHTTREYSVRDLKFRVRENTWDEGIVGEVIHGQAYTVLLDHLEPGEVYLDIGAHIGAFSVLAASRGARVFAFEPAPDNYALLVENAALNGLADRVTALNQAVWSSNARRSMAAPGDNTGGSGLYWPGGPEGLAVECVGLRDFLQRQNLSRCRGMKLDCEGSEYEILYSLEPTDLQRFDVIGMEYHRVAGHDAAQLAAYLQDAGFTTMQIPVEPVEEGLGIIHALRNDYLLGKIMAFEPASLRVGPHLVESRYTRLPVVGRIWRALRRGAHELVVFYVNKAAARQDDFNDAFGWMARMLGQHMQRTRRWQTSEGRRDGDGRLDS